MDYLLKASIVIAIFFCVYTFLLKKETFFQQNRWFLLVGLIVATTLPFLVIPIEIAVEPLPYQPVYAIEESPAITQQMTSETGAFDWQSLLSMVYILGLILFIIQFILQFGSLVLLLLKNPKRKDGIYTYVIVKTNISPFSFFKWIVYNPEQMDNEEVQLMLTHEKVHVNQLHSLDIILAQLACTLFWFNPLMWLYRKDIRQNLEYIADFETQSSTEDTKTYQKLLLKTSVANKPVALTNNFYNSLIKERIVMLQKSRSRTKKQWRYLLVLPLLSIVLMSMNTKEVYVEKSPPTKAEGSSKETNPEIEIIFTKSTTDKQLEAIKKELNDNGISMTIKTLKRNSNGEISSIDVDFETPNGSANYNISNEDGISDFYFKSAKDGSFGVGAMNRKEIIFIEETVTPSQKVIIHEGDDEKHEIIIKEDDDKNIKTLNSKSYVFKKGNGSEIIIEVDSLSSGKSWIDKNNFTYIEGSSPDSIYFNKDVKIIKTTGNRFKYKTGGSEKEEEVDIEFKGGKFGKTPLFIINGEAKDMGMPQGLDKDKIKSVTVLKEDNAVKVYGERGKNGVIIIDTKESLKDKAKSKWVVRTEVNSIGYVDDEDESKNATLAYISKYTPDDILDKNKSLLEKTGLKVKYSKIRRNEAGEITSIKIKVRNDSGDESSATWKNDDGIPEIEYGIWKGSLIARTSKRSF